MKRVYFRPGDDVVYAYRAPNNKERFLSDLHVFISSISRLNTEVRRVVGYWELRVVKLKVTRYYANAGNCVSSNRKLKKYYVRDR